MRISDYMEVAPDYVPKSAVDTMVSRIARKDVRSLLQRTPKWLNFVAFMDSDLHRLASKCKVDRNADRGRMQLFWSRNSPRKTDETALLMRAPVMIQSSVYSKQIMRVDPKCVSIVEECFCDFIGTLEDKRIVVAGICDEDGLQLKDQIVHGHRSAFQTRIFESEHSISDDVGY